MIKKSELWQRIRAARKRAGLRQSDLSDHLAVDRTAVTQWEAKNPERRTRPDIARLEAIGKITRTPLWWLLSDDVDVGDPWPEVADECTDVVAPKAASLQQHIQDFWSSACLQARERRQDLWSSEIWGPVGPRWMMPILPDAMTQRAIVQFVNSVKPDLARIASAASALLAFEQTMGRPYERKVVLIWKPKAKGLPKEYDSYLEHVTRISYEAHMLADSLRVKLIEVDTPAAAAEYLAQIL